MLLFVIPLKSQQTSKSWETVSRLFERTIKSVCNQSSNSFRVVVVCHELPNNQYIHPYVDYVRVEFPQVSSQDQVNLLIRKRTDKVRKVLTGIKYAQENYSFTHIMVVDADDCVSKHLAQLVEQSPQNNGWFVNKGYLYKEGSKYLYIKRQNFDRWCGTSIILRRDLYPLPETLESNNLDYYNRYYIPHSKAVELLANRETPISPLPFPGSVYIVCHNENVLRKENLINPKGLLPKIKKVLFNYRPITLSIRKDFGLY
ncbi:glycosyltransferase family 2 protein [Okeania sp.]|uniref:glycosyltransferase family 2 protein n=1 Tax=Okeania sp. TaxID=3100323 RepID=UPI002B4B0BDE|nr:glycosyltransferase family 2 protein [Okeania sp.]MEB3341991.1 glycosyltransferase family 2 protein [Okeania sp.]